MKWLEAICLSFTKQFLSNIYVTISRCKLSSIVYEFASGALQTQLIVSLQWRQCVHMIASNVSSREAMLPVQMQENPAVTRNDQVVS